MFRPGCHSKSSTVIPAKHVVWWSLGRLKLCTMPQVRASSPKAPSSTQTTKRFFQAWKVTLGKRVDGALYNSSTLLYLVAPLTLSASLPVPVPLELVVRGDGRREPALLQLQAVAFRLPSCFFFLSRARKRRKGRGVTVGAGEWGVKSVSAPPSSSSLRCVLAAKHVRDSGKHSRVERSSFLSSLCAKQNTREKTEQKTFAESRSSAVVPIVDVEGGWFWRLCPMTWIACLSAPNHTRG